MAGGKETPRQKMIGMMYLVLTALLALNVSTTVIEKFIFINDSLERANAAAENRNVSTTSSIQDKVSKSNNEAEKQILDAAKQIRNATEILNKEMDVLKDTFIIITGGYLEGKEKTNANIAGKTDYDKVGNYMMPIEEGGSGRGAVLRKDLEDYIAFLNTTLSKFNTENVTAPVFENIAKDAEEDEIYKHDENQKGKKFSQLAFENSPTPAGMATLSEFQAQVLSYETEALKFLADRVGAGSIEINTIEPMVLPVSQYVVAGSKYQAEMFIAASTSSVVPPTMTLDGNPLEVSGNRGKVEFTARASNNEYSKDGYAEKSFEAKITVQNRDGQDTTFTENITYYVIKPVIQVQSQSVNALYLNCGNELTVTVPGLGSNYNPSFTAKGGVAVKGGSGGQVTIVPKSSKVTLTVSNSGSLIGSRVFNVRRIPAPEIQAFIGNRAVNLKTGIPAKTPRIDLKAIADESFQKFLPKDANFRVTGAEITLVRAGIGGQSIRVNGPVVNLGPIAAQARKGDNLVIEIKKVARANFRKEIEDFPNFTGKFITIPLR